MSRGLQEALQTLCESGHLDRALDVLLRLNTGAPTSSYISLFTACSKNKALTTTRLLHAHLFLLGFSLSPAVGQHLVVALAKCGAVDDALHVSYGLSNRNVVSWTAIISAFASSGYGSEALRVYHCMLEDGIEPDHYTFVGLFKACGSVHDLVQGRAVHAEARQRGFGQDIFMASTLIVMYSKCGSIVESENVFNALKEHDIVTWNSMLTAYVEHGEGEKALRLYLMMEEAGCSPNDRTYVSVFQVCAMIAQDTDAFCLNNVATVLTALQVGQVLHASAEKKGFTQNAFVGNCLLTMYGKCGAVGEAEHVFATLQECTCVSWNAMLSAYVTQGQAIVALGIYKVMVSQGVSLDHLTFVSAFQACAIFSEKGESFLVKGELTKLCALSIGRALHSKARRSGFMSFAILCNSLISLYGKCGAVAEAEHVFAAMLSRNEVSFNAMLSTYNDQDQGEKTLQLYTQMGLEGVSPDEGTFVLTLEACTLLLEKKELVHENEKICRSRALHIGHVLHTEAQLKGCRINSFVTSSLICMYGKCGAIMEAEFVFGAELICSLVLWNAMISSYVTQGQEISALQLYRQMHEEGIAPDQLTFMMAVLACATLIEKEYPSFERQQIKFMSLDIGRGLHADAKRRCLTHDAYVGSSLMSLYAKHGSVAEVEHVLDVVTQRDTVLWNVMLSTYSQWGMGRESLQLFAQMLKKNVTSDYQTLVIALKACAGLIGEEFIPLAQGMSTKEMPLVIAHVLGEHAQGQGFASNAIVNSALVNLYNKLGAIEEAEFVFHQIPNHTVATWTAMISAYVDHGERLKALHLYQQLQGSCVALNHITLTCILRACIEIGSFESCERLHFDIISIGYDQILSVSATVLYAYGTQSSMPDVQALFDKLLEADMVSWNACIGGHAGSGNCVASLQVLELLKCAGLKPDGTMLTLVLAACSHSGLVAEGLEYLVSSRRDYDTLLDSKHCATILDLLGRAGDFSKAKIVLGMMPPTANQDTLLSLLGACQAHGNVELAEHTFDIAIKVEHTRATAFVLMSNVLAHAALLDHELMAG
ncbi:hypothetical protein L7F22_027386 [Adiantum nelumboides]|nr:hypothetical protein [Adiantum nelumboides]